MDGATIGGMALLAFFVGIYIYAWRHRDEPFWFGFLTWWE